MAPTKNIDVKDINADMVSEITKAAKEVQPQTDGSKVVGLNFQTTKGSIAEGISLLAFMHHQSEMEFTSHASGELTLGPILPLAGGKFGERKCESTALFVFAEDNAKVGKGRKALTASEKNALEILDKLSGGRKARIKAFMLASSKATAAEMKSLGLIDKIEGEFVDKYAQARIDAKKRK